MSDLRSKDGPRTAPTAPARRPAGATAKALFVNGPKGGFRQILGEGFVRIGRGTGCSIVLDDERVSRSHAALQVGDEIMLSDLGSANGTFIGAERLVPGQPRPLALNQSFLVGESTLVIQSTSLPVTCSSRVASIDELHRKPRGHTGGESRDVLVVKLRYLKDRPDPALSEAIIAGILQPWPESFVAMEAGEAWLVTFGEHPTRDYLERTLVEQLASWNFVVETETASTTADDLAETRDLRDVLQARLPIAFKGRTFVVRDRKMEALWRRVMRIAPSPVNVLLLGETGCGKDVVASLVHELSDRARGPFVTVNCASMPDTLLESELFGHERGAFTGAAAAKPGLFESADGGTIFLDEIGEVPLALQAKLLRVVETREVTRLGAVRPCLVDIRCVAATNRDLVAEVTAGRFRRDLYHRLNVMTLTVPPLRERLSEVEPLANLFLAQAVSRFGLRKLQWSPAALAKLLAHRWPGNVRELRNVVERAALLVTGSVIEVADLELISSTDGDAPGNATAAVEAALAPVAFKAVPVSEGERIAEALATCGGNQRRAATLLGMSRRTLVRRIAQLKLPRPRLPGQ
jgi:DNA-binding NtrC family response regulator/pSer/pThr/pTyr-binding forkhead associated (FHA) protein